MLCAFINFTPKNMRLKLFTTKETFHLNLKKEWFDMILSGEKKEEYRDITDYWKNRFAKLFTTKFLGETYYPIVETITFSNGYAKDRRQFEIEWKGTMIGKGKEEWGADSDKEYYVFQLGKVLQSNCT